jgi:hypothetical protein
LHILKDRRFVAVLLFALPSCLDTSVVACREDTNCPAGEACGAPGRCEPAASVDYCHDATGQCPANTDCDRGGTGPQTCPCQYPFVRSGAACVPSSRNICAKPNGTTVHGSWLQLPSRPSLLGGACWAYDNGHVYMFGGVEKTSAQFPAPVGNSDVLDLVTMRWNPGQRPPQSMQTPTVESGCDVIGGLVYVAGGRVSVQEGLGSGNSRVFQIYDILADSWSSGPDLPILRAWPATAVMNGTLFLVGGDGTSYLPSTTTFKPGAAIWNDLRAALPSGRYSGAAVVIDGNLVMLGGSSFQTGPNVAYPDVLQLDPSMGKWTQVATLPFNADGLAAAVHGANAYISANGELWRMDSGNFQFTDLGAIPGDDGTTGATRVLLSIPEALLTGGTGRDGGGSGDVWAYCF